MRGSGMFLGSIMAVGIATAQETSSRPKLVVDEFALDNGLRVLTVERPEVPRVYCSIWWRVGSVHERPGITGLAHFFEHLMFKGTETIGTRDSRRDAEINARIHELMENVRKIKLENLERLRRGEPLKETNDHLREYENLVREQKEIGISEHFWRILQSHGGTGLNATTYYDRTNYFVELPANKIELWFWLESDRFLRPVFREFYPEREVVKEERRMRVESTPTGLIYEAFHSMFWQAHPYGWPVIGWLSDIDQYRLSDAERFFREHYSPENASVILVGDVQAAQVRELARRYFGRLPKRTGEPRPPIVTQEPEQVAERRMHARADTQPTVAIYWHAPPAVHKDVAEVDLLSSLLDGRTGRLHRRLVDQKELALGVSCSYEALRYGGVVRVSATPKIDPRPETMAEEEYRAYVRERYAEVEKEIYDVIATLQTEGPTASELRRSKDKILADIVRQMRGNAGVGQYLGYYEVVGTWRDFETYLDRLEAATGEGIQRVARRILRPEGRNVLVLSRKEEP